MKSFQSRLLVAIVVSSLGAASLVLPGRPLFAEEYAIVPGESVFAVLTHKAGLAAALAHDHLVVAADPNVTLRFDPSHPEAAEVSFVTRVESLEVDAPGGRARWTPRLRELGALSRELPPVPEGDRRKVREAMLGASQLDGARFPEIRAEVLGLEPAASEAPSGQMHAELALRLTIRGRTVERRQPVTWKLTEDRLEAEVLSELQFQDFGIEPYSTMLGAIRNDARFHLYVMVVARRAP